MNDERIAAAARQFVSLVTERDAQENTTPFGEGDFLHPDEQEAWRQLRSAIDQPDPRMEPPHGSAPEGEGFGKPWVPRERIYLVSGALIRSIVDTEQGRGLVAIDLGGRWNHGEDEDLSLIAHRDVADEWATSSATPSLPPAKTRPFGGRAVAEAWEVDAVGHELAARPELASALGRELGEILVDLAGGYGAGLVHASVHRLVEAAWQHPQLRPALEAERHLLGIEQ